MYGNHAPTLRNLALKVLSQTASSSACERNRNTFALIHTKQRNQQAYPRLQQLVFCYYNMKLKISDMQAKTDKVAEKYYLNLLDISIEFGEEEDNQLFQWVRPLHLDDENGNLDLRIDAHVREAGVDVEQVLSEEVHSESFSQETRDSFSLLSLLDPLLIQVLNIVVDLVLLVLLLQAMMAQEERGPMMVVILEMMIGIMHIDNKVNIHRVHSLVKMISHMRHKMKTMGLGELVQVLEPLESHIEVDEEE